MAYHLFRPSEPTASPNFCLTCAPFLRSDVFTYKKMANFSSNQHILKIDANWEMALSYQISGFEMN